MAEIIKRLNETMAEVNEVSKLGSRASRKRSSQDVDDFLPCKRYRLDMNVVGYNHAMGYESPTIKAINNRSNSKRLITHGKSSRYYRPMFRLLRSVKVDTTIDADVSNILRQCKEKSFAREIVKNDDGLFGSSTSHSPACTFRGWTPAYKNINQLKSPLAAQDTDNSLICSSPAEVIVGMNKPSHASNVTKMKETPRKVVDVGCQCNMYINTLTEHKIDGSNIPSSPSEGVTSTIDIPSNVTTSCVGSEPKTPSQGLPSSNLIFDFMPVNTPIIPRSIKRSSLSTPKHGSVTLRRLPLSLRASHQLRLHASFRTPAVKAVMRSRHRSQSAGAITPRNNRPYIARYIQATLPTTATHTVKEESIITPSLSNSSSYTTSSDNGSMCHVDIEETKSPLDGIASIGKRILRYAAERLRGSNIKVQSSEDFQTTTPSTMYHQASPTTPNIAPQYLLQRGILSSSSKLPTPCRLQFPPSSSDRSFLTSNNDRNDSFNRNHASTKHNNRAATTPHLVKNPTNLLPCPRKGWENLFQPKDREWKCKLCFYINPVEAKTCDSCMAIDDRYSSLGTQSSLGRAVSKNTTVTPCETTTIGNNRNVVNETVGHKSVRVAAPPPPVSILRNGKSSQRRTTAGSGKRFKQDNTDMMDVG